MKKWRFTNIIANAKYNYYTMITHDIKHTSVQTQHIHKIIMGIENAKMNIQKYKGWINK